MNQPPQVVPQKTSANGFVHRRVEKESSGKLEKKAQLMKSGSGNFNNIGLANGGKLGYASPARDRLTYIMTQLRGRPVEVHVRNGSVISGILHGNNDKDFGIVLKMAQFSIGGQKPLADVVKKPQTMIIPARELVQVLAKDVAIFGDELTNGNAHDKRKDLMIDSVISNSHHAEERELERWAPDEDDPDFVELEQPYDRKWTRNWDQFEINKTLFGVKSTFDEELYTTKLERGPHMRDLEKHASRIAREIEGEETEDIHLAEERGLYLDKDLDHDEETKYSAVCRDIDSSRFQGSSKPSTSASNAMSYFDSFSRTNSNEAEESSTSSVDKEGPPPCVVADRNSSPNIPTNYSSLPTSEYSSKKIQSVDEESRADEKKVITDHDNEKSTQNVHAERPFSEDGKPSISEDLQSIDLKRPSSSSYSSDPSSSGRGSKGPDDFNSDSAVAGKLLSKSEPLNSSLRPSSSTSPTSERAGAGTVSGGLGISPSSSMGSLSSAKSTLNPNAKEFKLNPNAKSFTPLVPRPQTPVSDGSFYYPNNSSAVAHLPVPMGMGIPQTFGGHQPYVYGPQGPHLQPPQGYMQPPGPLYGQQMMFGQQRPVYFMTPQYSPEMQYRGRNF